MNAFQLVLTDEEKRFCKDLIRYVISDHLGQAAGPKPALASETLNMELGAFVTLKRQGRLRGCIGNIVGNGPLVATIERMAGAAAFEDPRFPPLKADEIDGLLRALDGRLRGAFLLFMVERGGLEMRGWMRAL